MDEKKGFGGGGSLRVDGVVLFGERLLLLNEDAGTSR